MFSEMCLPCTTWFLVSAFLLSASGYEVRVIVNFLLGGEIIFHFPPPPADGIIISLVAGTASGNMCDQKELGAMFLISFIARPLYTL
jgi:hypothetical protein